MVLLFLGIPLNSCHGTKIERTGLLSAQLQRRSKKLCRVSLRWKICNYGYDFYLRTGGLNWSFDPEIASLAEWKREMSQDGCWGDEIFLVLASNILQLDLKIVPAFWESSINQGLGFTLIKSLGSNLAGTLPEHLSQQRRKCPPQLLEGESGCAQPDKNFYTAVNIPREQAWDQWGKFDLSWSACCWRQ